MAKAVDPVFCRHGSPRRRRLVRIPALALLAVLAAAWAPCLACESSAHAADQPGLVTAASCHLVSDASGASCAPEIRVASSALRTDGVPAAGPPVLQASPLLELRPPSPLSAPAPRTRLAPIQRPPLYLLNESLLA
jgi:hypothetical protein